MDAFLFRLKLKPLSSGPHYLKVKGSYGVVLVLGWNIDDAEVTARDYCHQYGWQVLELLERKQTYSAEQLLQTETHAMLAAVALRFGVAGEIAFVGIDDAPDVDFSSN